MCGEYNGWRNWETWNANLWMSEASVDQSIVDALLEETGETEPELTDIAEMVEQWFEEAFVESKPYGPVGDAIGMYMSMVDWERIAEHIIEEVANVRKASA